MILRFIDAIGRFILSILAMPASHRRHLNLANYSCLRFMPASFKHLPKAPGLYIVLKGANMLYIGKSVNLHSRWNGEGQREHHRLDLLVKVKAERICFIELPAARITVTEAQAIAHWKPVFNSVRKLC